MLLRTNIVVLNVLKLYWTTKSCYDKLEKVTDAFHIL